MYKRQKVRHICKFCTTQYKTSRRRQRFCSKECRKNYAKLTNWKLRKIQEAQRRYYENHRKELKKKALDQYYKGFKKIDDTFKITLEDHQKKLLREYPSSNTVTSKRIFNLLKELDIKTCFNRSYLSRILYNEVSYKFTRERLYAILGTPHTNDLLKVIDQVMQKDPNFLEQILKLRDPISKQSAPLGSKKLNVKELEQIYNRKLSPEELRIVMEDNA